MSVSLRYALLALLTSRPMTGYDLSKHFSQSVAHVWYAPDSQIYPELNRMERDGLVDSATVPWGPKGTKKEYRITDEGTAAFREWINEPLVIRRQRDPAYLKSAYLEWADPEAARAQLRQHLEYWSQHLQMLKETRQSLIDHTHPTLQYRLKKFPEAEHDRIVRYKVFAYDGLIDNAAAEVRWARKGLALIDELEGESP
jgi:DNA-binding PadR family transcriptional regulator